MSLIVVQRTCLRQSNNTRTLCGTFAICDSHNFIFSLVCVVCDFSSAQFSTLLFVLLHSPFLSCGHLQFWIYFRFLFYLLNINNHCDSALQVCVILPKKNERLRMKKKKKKIIIATKVTTAAAAATAATLIQTNTCCSIHAIKWDTYRKLNQVLCNINKSQYL